MALTRNGVNWSRHRLPSPAAGAGMPIQSSSVRRNTSKETEEIARPHRMSQHAGKRGNRPRPHGLPTHGDAANGCRDLAGRGARRAVVTELPGKYDLDQQQGENRDQQPSCDLGADAARVEVAMGCRPTARGNSRRRWS